MGSNIGFLLVIVGLFIALLGLIIWSGALSWFGKLPGDIRIERDNVKIYIPLVSMAILSIALSALIHIFKKIFK